MWLLLVAAGSGYLIRCYHKALHANTPASDSTESATTAGTQSNTSSSFQTDTIRSLSPFRSDSSDESFQSEFGDLPGVIDKSDELQASGKDVIKTDKEYRGNCDKYLDWGSRCGPIERKFTASTDRRNRDRVLTRKSQNEVRRKYASSNLKRASGNFQIELKQELYSTGSSDFYDNVTGTSQRLPEDGTNYIEASDAFLPKPLSTGHGCHQAEPITSIESQGMYVQDAWLETPSESKAKASFVPFPHVSSATSVDFDKRTSDKQQYLLIEKESEERNVEEGCNLPNVSNALDYLTQETVRSQEIGLNEKAFLSEQISPISNSGNSGLDIFEMQISNDCAPFDWKRRKGLIPGIEDIEREEANQLFLQTQGLSLISKKIKLFQKTESSRRFKEDKTISEGLVGSVLGALLFSFGVGVGLLHMLFSFKLNDSSQSLRQIGNWVEETRPDYEAESNFKPNNSLSIWATNEQYLSLGSIAYDEKTEGLEELISFRESHFITEKLTECFKCPSATAVKPERHEADLEVELQAELEFLLTGFANKGSSQQQRELLNNSDLGLDWAIGSRDSEAISEFHKTFCTEQAKDHSAQLETQNQAVSPWELDRRLRILLESRQEERILELEAEVNALLGKLRMKDQELQIWKHRFEQMIMATQASSLGNWIDIKRTIPSDKVAAGVLDEQDTSLGNGFNEENEYSETCESWPSSLDKNPVDGTETLINITDKVSIGNVQNMSAVCGSRLGSKEGMVSAGCCSNSSSNCSRPYQCLTVGDFGDWSVTNDGVVRYLLNLAVNTSGSEKKVMCTVTDESGRAINCVEASRLHASTSEFFYDTLNRSNEELIISRHDKTTVGFDKAKSEAFLVRDPSNVSSSCLKAANSKTDTHANDLIGSLQKSNHDHVQAYRDFDRQPSSSQSANTNNHDHFQASRDFDRQPSSTQSASTDNHDHFQASRDFDRQLSRIHSASNDVKDFAASKGESSRCPAANNALGCSTEFPLVWEESSASDDSPSDEFITQIIERKRRGSKMFKDAQLVMSMLEEDEQSVIDDIVHMSKAIGGDENLSKEKQKCAFGSEGCNDVEPSSTTGMLRFLRENVGRMKTTGEKRDILEDFFESEDFIKFKSTIE